MTAHVTQLVVDAGTKPTFNAATVADTVEHGNGKNTFLVYKNTGTQKTITITAPGVNGYGQNNPDPALTLPATTGELWIPLRNDYDDSANAGVGRCTITMTPDATGVTVAVVQVG